MYEVFINNRPLVFDENQKIDNSFSITYSDDINWQEIVVSLESNKREKANIVCADIEIAWQSFIASFHKIIAGGGVVRNKNKELLFIFRNGKWDLPKGKLEQNENIETCSLREVEEECGVNGLQIVSKLNKSYHMYFQNSWILKETNWFIMDTSFDGQLIAQIEEGIQLVDWKSDEQIKECLLNTYSNIEKVIKNYYESIS
ncbi:MAG: NUDIX domain-containing protein [Flavobacteriales bacterium]